METETGKTFSAKSPYTESIVEGEAFISLRVVGPGKLVLEVAKFERNISGMPAYEPQRLTVTTQTLGAIGKVIQSYQEVAKRNKDKIAKQ